MNNLEQNFSKLSIKFYVLVFTIFGLDEKELKSNHCHYLNNFDITQVPIATYQKKGQRSVGSREKTFNFFSIMGAKLVI